MMEAEQVQKFRTKLLGLIPTDGSAVSNPTLSAQLKAAVAPEEISDNDYWQIRQPLIDEGIVAIGRGYGGTVKRVLVQAENVPPQPVAEAPVGEAALYEPFQASMDRFTKSEGLDSYILLKTAMQGRRSTGGKWTRPDVTLVAVRTFEFIPGKHLEVISFEIKPALDSALEGVFEALAHSAFAHRSYLAVKTTAPETTGPNQDLERVSSECARHGVGLYTFTDPGDFSSFQLQQDALRRNADPAKVNAFLATQVDQENKARIRAMVR